MKQILLPIIVGCIGGLLINLFYNVAKTRWPEHYFTTSQVVDRVISSSWLKYGVFRTLPPYFLGTLTAAAAIRYGVSVGWTLVVCGTVHLATTVGRAILEGVCTNGPKGRLVVAYFGAAVLTIISLCLAGLTSRWWFPLMPGPDKYVEVALTGVAAALAVHYLQEMTQNTVDVEKLVSGFGKRISPEMVKRLAAACARHRVDYDLAYTILVTEATERPRWFRLMERIGGAVGLAATYGIMQSSRDRRISDEQSIDQAMAASLMPSSKGHTDSTEK